MQLMRRLRPALVRLVYCRPAQPLLLCAHTFTLNWSSGFAPLQHRLSHGAQQGQCGRCLRRQEALHGGIVAHLRTLHCCQSLSWGEGLHCSHL